MISIVIDYFVFLLLSFFYNTLRGIKLDIPNIKVVFLSQSRRQTKQYELLCKKADIKGSIINIKRQGVFGCFIKAGKWLLRNRGCIPKWV